VSERYFCCDRRRVNEVREHPSLNGVEWVEVVDDPSEAPEERQRTLVVRFIKEVEAHALGAENFVVEGGERIRKIAVTGVPRGRTGPPARGHEMHLRVNQAGDFSAYTLRVVKSARDLGPPPHFDPLLSSVEFSFKVNCPTDFDCEAERACAPAAAPAPEINYLAKDYASFRQLMLDRMSVLLPRWKERNAADLGVALVEVLAYVGDYLSYRQDAVATEAYIGTARRRVSVSRHARLVDYRVHNGANARAWVQVSVSADAQLPAGTRIFSRVTGVASRIQPFAGNPPRPTPEYERAVAARPAVFETVADARLYAAHNEFEFYTWGDDRCCLPRGATSATLRNRGGAVEELAAGDVLAFVEQRNPHNGKLEEADPAHRHAVRLTKVRYTYDPLFQVTDGIQGTSIIEISWHVEDALPFSLCLWDVLADDGSKHPASVALGNLVLADHGETVGGESLGTVPEPLPALAKVRARRGDSCDDAEPEPTAPRFSPRLRRGPLTYAASAEVLARAHSASAVMRLPAADTVPAVVELLGTAREGEPLPWEARRDLLDSGPTDRHFAVEVEEDGTAALRFGDERFGSRPAAGTSFVATYRVGVGVAGNVGAGALAHVVTEEAAVTGVANPLPARGGVEPESIEEVRRDAPAAFRTQGRAVTPDDYARVAERHPGVQRAAATFRWTGSWRTVFLTIDRLGGGKVDDELKAEMRQHLERYRMAGHDVEINGPLYVSLELGLHVCARPEYFNGDVRAALLEVFGNRTYAGGRRGLFHPDNFTFGQSVYLSALYAAAQNVEGVSSVEIRRFHRQGQPSAEAVETGELKLERLEIARLDNDPNFPEHGVIQLEVEGGR